MEIGRRIIVVGNTGSGKSTLARELSLLFDMPHIELDGLYWKPNWKESTTAEFRQKVENALTTADETWVADGNGRVVRDIVWTQEDTLIWLDYPLYIIFWRLCWRTLKRTLTKIELWNGNRERFWVQFLSRDSLFLWAWQSHHNRNRTYSDIISQNQFPNLQVLRFKHPRETTKWLRQLRVAYSAPEESQP